MMVNGLVAPNVSSQSQWRSGWGPAQNEPPKENPTTANTRLETPAVNPHAGQCQAVKTPAATKTPMAISWIAPLGEGPLPDSHHHIVTNAER